MIAVNKPIFPLSAHRHSELISAFKSGKYIDVIRRSFVLPPSYLMFHFLSRSCDKVNAPLELIQYINYFLSLPPAVYSRQKALFPKLAAIDIPTVDQLLACTGQTGDPLKLKRVAIERFIFDNSNLFVIRDYEDKTSARLLSNLMNILGDTYRLQGQARAAFEVLKLANTLFPDSVYSRVNFADLAYHLNELRLCLESLKHVNHLMYYSSVAGDGHCYNPYLNEVGPINDLVFKNFMTLSMRCGFRPG